MRERPDPLVPVLGSAVAGLVILTVGFIFYPRISHWLEVRSSVAVERNGYEERNVPVWVCRSEDGVALILQPTLDADAARTLDRLLGGAGRSYLRLSIYNFARPEPYILQVPPEGFDSPEGGPRALPVARLVRGDAPLHVVTVMAGLGAVERVDVEEGHAGKVLLAIAGDPAPRSAFVSGRLRFERRELDRRTLARWEAKPDLKGFLDF